MEKQLYFAYGSNLNLEDLKIWCKKKNLEYPIKKVITTAYLPDHHYIYNYYSNSRGGGALNLCKQLGHVVHGVVFELVKNGWDALDLKEGAPYVYERKNVTLITEENQIYKAETYFVTPDYVESKTIPPTRKYQNILWEGMETFGIQGKRQLRDASTGSTMQSLVPYIFVYGTLLQGERNHYLLSLEDGCEHICPADAAGILYNLGNFPGVIYQNLRQVEGELVYHRNIQNLLKSLDSLESFYGYDDDDMSMYFRMLTWTYFQDIQKLAWIYYINPKCIQGARQIVSGDWRKK